MVFASLEAASFARIVKFLDPTYTLVQRTNGRSDLAFAAWRIFLVNPLGVGTGGFAPAFAELGNLGGLLTFSHLGQEFQAHSAWMKTLAENGFPGFILLAAYVTSFTISARRRKQPELIWLGLMVTFTLSVAFLSTEFQGKGLWFLAAGATTLLNQSTVQTSLHGTLGTSKPPSTHHV